jgi:hypothetical protein
MEAQDAAASNELLACGHRVELAVGTRVYNHYDCGFGVVVKVDDGHYRAPGENRWHDVRSDGAKYWLAGKVTMLDRERMVCEPCGDREQARRAR